MYTEESLNTIYQAITPQGLLASSHAMDNYARVWSRDSMMTGMVAGILQNDEKILESFKQSIITLADHQSDNGQMPSNVYYTSAGAKVSYGSLVGRVDATTWWIIGACSYILHTDDQELKNNLSPKFTKAFQILKSWEYNDRGLIYTPLGGNWADEYISSGYTLYDNALNYWAMMLFAKVYKDEAMSHQARQLKKEIQINFNIQKNSDATPYHPRAFAQAVNPNMNYMPSTFSANGYDTRWDMAGNALALLLGLNESPQQLKHYLNYLQSALGHWMLPVFFPVIKKEDWQWQLLENNYSYNFKNTPYNFHNGGSWPIFLGWLCYALKNINEHDTAFSISETYQSLVQQNPENKFCEYWSTDSLKPKGTPDLCFSASGYLLMTSKFKYKLLTDF